MNRAAALSSDCDFQDALGDSSGNYCARTNPSVDGVVLVVEATLGKDSSLPRVTENKFNNLRNINWCPEIFGENKDVEYDSSPT
ncbi:hypothetical protein NHX12_013999 [Muraenolepis orangiensis]|uniref:Uncharacterized protein n=1 Tax=Muraenolepis orangiensis TaxID=630683 RepID=A0A9Q0DB47_9TELE|nr:hypothetical protein NHX12_013999 [Muraenolepis orangiensis]